MIQLILHSHTYTYIYTVIQSIIPSIMLRKNIAHEQSTYQKLSGHDRRYSWSLLVVHLSSYIRTLYRKRERQRCLLNTFSKPHVLIAILTGPAFAKKVFDQTGRKDQSPISESRILFSSILLNLRSI